jgi:zinc protease
MLNRKIAPPIKAIENIILPRPEVVTLDNGVAVHIISSGTQKVLKVEVIFRAGRPHEHGKLLSRATAGLLKEGTRDRSSVVIAEDIDFYGGSITSPFSIDASCAALHCLTKHFSDLLPIFSEILTQADFPQKELETYIENNKQALTVELTKNDVIAYRKITEYMYGADHAYGYNSDAATYDALRRDDVLEHYKAHYHAGNMTIIVSGLVDDSHIALINSYLGKVEAKPQSPSRFTAIAEVVPQKIKIQHDDTLQTAIKIGRRLFTKSHPDYAGMYVLNTILGGYFGSRLMMNIREDKGYTYNIYSTLEAMQYDGYLYIATEVSNEFVEATKAEIYKECALLQQKLVGKAELEMLRNYLLGAFLTTIDGAFNVSDVVKTYIAEDLPISLFDDLVNTVKTITSADIRRLARKYLNPEDLWEVVVGV